MTRKFGFEYKVHELSYGKIGMSIVQSIEKQLNELGREGWELVATYNSYMIFMRKIG